MSMRRARRNSRGTYKAKRGGKSIAILRKGLGYTGKVGHSWPPLDSDSTLAEASRFWDRFVDQRPESASSPSFPASVTSSGR